MWIHLVMARTECFCLSKFYGPLRSELNVQRAFNNNICRNYYFVTRQETLICVNDNVNNEIFNT